MTQEITHFSIDMTPYEDRARYEPMRLKSWPRDDAAWERVQKLKPTLDSLTVDVIGGALQWAVEEGEAVVERMARSSIIRAQLAYRA